MDIFPAILDEARANATIAAVEIDWQEGTATGLLFEDDVSDVSISCLGHMFAEPPDVPVRELLRVTRPGGWITFTSATGFCSPKQKNTNTNA